MADNYDLLVIGAGPGGLSAARRAAGYGVNVAIVEAQHVGGVCANEGCIPKKLMVYAADFSRAFANAKGYGWQIAPGQFDWQRFLDARNQELERIRQSTQTKLAEAGIEVISGKAAFLDPHNVAVGDRSISADKILIAVGGKPIQPDIPGIEQTLTSHDLLQLAELPPRIAMIGAGYIGVEFASILRNFGSQVTLMNQEDCILSGFDPDLANAVRDGLAQRGIRSLCSTTAKEIQPTADGLQLSLSGDHSETLTVDAVLCAIGRTPNLEGLGLDRAGVEVEGKAIAVDAHSRTSQAHIFAVGDCTNRVPLTPVARAEGRAFADTVFGNQTWQPDYETVPSAVFTRPEAAAVGLTEPQARERYGEDDVQCDRIEFIPLFGRLSSHASTGLIKLVVRRSSHQIIGVHIVGEHAAEIIQGIALAMRKGITRQDLDHMMGIHPTSAEEFFG